MLGSASKKTQALGNTGATSDSVYLSDLNLRKLICPEAKQQTKPFYRLKNFQNIYFGTSTHIHFAWRPDRLRLRLRFRPWFRGRGRSRGTWIPAELISILFRHRCKTKTINMKCDSAFGTVGRRISLSVDAFLSLVSLLCWRLSSNFCAPLGLCKTR